MRVLIITPEFFPEESGGVPVVVRSLAKGLTKMGDQVFVLTRSLDSTRPSRGIFQGIDYQIEPVRYRSLLSIKSKALTILQQYQPDVVNLHYPIAGPALLTLAIKSIQPQMPIVTSLHLRELWHPNLIERILAHRVVNKSEIVTTNSKYMTDRVKRWKNSLVIHNGVEVPNDVKDYKHEKPYITSVGRLADEKDFPTLIRAFSIVTQQYPNIDLLIAGSGSREIQIKSLIKQLNTESKSNIRLLGQLSQREIFSLMKGALFFVITSVEEGFGLVALEASRLGKAVIATKTGGLTEIVRDGETGYLVPPKAPDLLAQKMMTLLEDKELRDKFGYNGKAIAETQFSWHDTIQKYHNAYTRAIHECKVTL